MVVKYCLARNCDNNSLTTPNKVFIRIPINTEIKQKWFNAINVPPNRSKANKFQFCCEDHFDLLHDAENFIEFRTIGVKLRMKKNIVPHLNLNTNKRHADESQLSLSAKKQRATNIESFHQSPVINDDKQLEPGTSCFHISPLKTYTDSPSSSLITSSTIPKEDISDSSLDEEIQTDKWRKLNKLVSLANIEMHSRFYLGLPKTEYFLINLLSNHTKINYEYILIILKKIRLNDPYDRLAVEFGYSEATISKIINSSTSLIANCMRQFIIWPVKKTILLNMPSKFLPNYNNVQSIIDCFEIKIQTSSNATPQALTWNKYKKCNTAKYLVSCTPNGLVNYISPGFGGRATGTEIVEQSGYLECIPEECVVVAGRGFENIVLQLHKKNCQLLRPSSLSADQKMTKHETKITKKIAALRIHVERLKRRISEFEILQPHSVVSINLIHLLDEMMVIACGIINIQGTSKK